MERSSSKPGDKLFIYGSLRRGGRYRHLVEPFVLAEVRAVVKGALFHFSMDGSGRGPYPYLTLGETIVYGDVLTLRDPVRAFEVLDELEECPTVYVRERISARYEDGSSGVVQVYRIPKDRAPTGDAIPGGDWLVEQISAIPASSRSADRCAFEAQANTDVRIEARNSVDARSGS
jgi:gamma-glutamylcyclotransferase (GGCT)/AIG2-like uncharacterized protein YtfP